MLIIPDCQNKTMPSSYDKMEHDQFIHMFFTVMRLERIAHLQFVRPHMSLLYNGLDGHHLTPALGDGNTFMMGALPSSGCTDVGLVKLVIMI